MYVCSEIMQKLMWDACQHDGGASQIPWYLSQHTPPSSTAHNHGWLTQLDSYPRRVA